jgi:hypothetical protein
VVSGKLAEFEPEGTVTLPGTDTVEASALRLTLVPPVGATPFKVIVSVELLRPCTSLESNASSINAGCKIASVNPIEAVEYDAVIFAEVVVATG